jgi:chromosome segregation ATPase
MNELQSFDHPKEPLHSIPKEEQNFETNLNNEQKSSLSAGGRRREKGKKHDKSDEKNGEHKKSRQKVFESADELIKKINDLKAQMIDRPDEKKTRARIKELNNSIEKTQEELEKIQKNIDDKNKVLQQYEEEMQQLFNSLNEYSKQIKETYKQRDTIQEKVDQLEVEKKSLQTMKNQLDKDCPFRTLTQIENKKRELNEELNETRDKKKEDVLVRQISKLEASKTMLDKLVSLDERMETLNKQIKIVAQQAKNKHAEVKELKSKRQQYFDKINEYKKKKAQVQEQKMKMNEVRKKLRQQVNKTYEEIQSLEKEHRQNNRKFNDIDSELKYLQQRLEQQREYERRQKERERRAKEREERQRKQEEFQKEWLEYEAERRKNPYESEIQLCSHLIAYLEQVKKNGKAAHLKRKAASLLGQDKMGKKSASTAINHPIDKFTAFQQLHIKPPTTYSQVDDALKTIREKKAYYKSFKVDDENNAMVEVSNAAPITTLEFSDTSFVTEENEGEQVKSKDELVKDDDDDNVENGESD